MLIFGSFVGRKGQLVPGQQRKAAMRDGAALSVCTPQSARSVDSRQHFELTTPETGSVARAGTPKCPQALSSAILGKPVTSFLKEIRS